ncbi:hypothetical protein GOBAR_DD31259 [Gossypium barbadense]|nr:hypothetical protein GOBAR_DD31259 [Gossypium barbadense]
MATNLVEGINAVLLKTRHLPIASVFSATFYRLATLMPRMGQQQVDQIEAGHVFVEHVRDTMVVNRRLLLRASAVDLVYQLGPMKLISRTNGASAEGASDDFRASPKQRAAEESERSSAVKQNP